MVYHLYVDESGKFSNLETVAAELAAWSLKYGDKKSGDAIAQFRQVYQKFANTYKDADMHNPFAALCEDLSSLSRFEDYIRITGVIAY